MMASAKEASVQIMESRSLHTYHEIQINVVNAERLQRAVDALLDTLVPRVVELGCDPDLLARDARVLDTLTNLLLVAVGKSRIDMAVSSLECGLDSLTDLTRLRLPCSQTDGGDLCAGVELRNLLAVDAT